MSSEGAAAIGSLLDAAADRLRAAGIVKPRREANRLWAWQNRITPGQAVLDRLREAEAPRREAFEAAVSRRVAGEPLAYVLGSTGFRTLELMVDRRALIPRPETELLVDQALRLVRSGRALDVCTGSGCLALALAAEGGFSQVIGSDVSRDAVALAALNVRASGLPVRLVRSDLGTAFRGARFDLVVSNPPYLSEAEYQALDASVKAWEPREALVSGPDGLAATRRLLAQAPGLLAPGGWLVMELDFSRGDLTAGLARGAGLVDVNVLNDLFGRARYLVARRGQGE
ncbi:MAG TPA: peptide chain release factor N(5)-glutamine methyltransferase [Gemmatimonadales bacterium]|nr:peptide chain release factor N(5)-glutamine methyltransferase [Gemmatimonadales bacterium]